MIEGPALAGAIIGFCIALWVLVVASMFGCHAPSFAPVAPIAGAETVPAGNASATCRDFYANEYGLHGRGK